MKTAIDNKSVMWRDQVTTTAWLSSVRFAFVCFMTCFLSYADDPALESFMNFDGMQSWLQHFVFGSLLVQPTDCMPKPHSQNSVFPSLLLKKEKKRFYGMHATPLERYKNASHSATGNFYFTNAVWSNLQIQSQALCQSHDWKIFFPFELLLL